MKRITQEVESGKPGKKVLVVAGVHGDEFEPIRTVKQLGQVLQGRLLNGRVELVAVANETAYAAGTRHGADGLDMARICPGDPTGTATEVSAYLVSEQIRNCDFLIDMHTGGLAYDIFPMVGYLLHPDAAVLEQQRDMAKASGLPLIWGTDHRPDGRTLSVARDSGIPALYFEYGGGSGFRKEVTDNYRQAIVNVLVHLGMIEEGHGGKGQRHTYWVEDHRTDSGHFQVKMPSPMDGIFIASVSVGEQVVAGQLVGEVFDPLTGTYGAVNADSNGIVHFLRVMVKVTKGDALGGILPAVAGGKEVFHD